jgi:hypothetical protein
MTPCGWLPNLVWGVVMVVGMLVAFTLGYREGTRRLHDRVMQSALWRQMLEQEEVVRQWKFRG